MQTFLPFSDFARSAQVLDNRRLGKQRVEAAQIWATIAGGRKGWANHPAVRMWRGHLEALAAYHNAVIREWVRRGFKNNMPLVLIMEIYEVPSWLGDERFHISHQSNLVRKLPGHYGPLFPGVPDNLPYFWPI